MKLFTVAANDANQRLDKFLRKAAPGLPPALLYKALRTKHIKVNGRRAHGDYRLLEGDAVACWLSDEFFSPSAYAFDFLRAGRQLEVLYEDERMLLLDKPAGLLSHPDEGEYVDTLLGRAQRYLYEKGEYDPGRENAFAPALVNRIDRNTQGIVIAAKTAQALCDLNGMMKRREIHKYYLCAVHNNAESKMQNAEWVQLRSWMSKDEGKALVRVHGAPGPGRKECLTNYRVLDARPSPLYPDACLLEVELLTGRTHQVRAQFAALGHALVGDGKYAPRAQYKAGPAKRQCLCSWRIQLGELDVSVGKVGFLEEIFPGVEIGKLGL